MARVHSHSQWQRLRRRAFAGARRLPAALASLRPPQTIRGRLLTLLLVAGVFVAGATFAYQIQARSQRIAERKDEIRQLSRLAAQVEQERFETARNLLIAASRFTPVRDAASSPNNPVLAGLCQQRLSEAMALLPESLVVIALADRQGNLTCTSNPVTGPPVNVADRLHFQRALADRSFSVGEVILTRDTGLPVLLFGYPMLDETGAAIGVIVTGYDLTLEHAVIGVSNLPDESILNVVDRNGVALSGASGEGGLQAFALDSLGDRDASEPVIVDGPDGFVEAVTRVTEPGQTPVYVALAVPHSYIGNLFSWSLLQQWLLVAEIIALAVLVFLILAHRLITRPISLLERQTTALAAGNVGARSGIAHDASEIGHLAEQFDAMAAHLEATLAERDQALRGLQEAIESKDEFVGMVSHEMRNLITPIVGGASILERHMERLDAESRAELVQSVRESGETLNRLIGDMFVLARMELGGQLDREPIAAERLAWAVRDEFAKLAPHRQLELRLQGRNYVEAEEMYLRQVLLNLLTNAHKYSPPESPITLSVGTNGAGRIEFAVADRGPGVEVHELDLIFERYYRSPGTASQVGTGLGLTVCKRLVEAQGGRIWARVREGGGLEIVFTLAQATLSDGRSGGAGGQADRPVLVPREQGLDGVPPAEPANISAAGHPQPDGGALPALGPGTRSQRG